MSIKLYDAEIEYLESTGTQYINLPFGFDKTDEIYFSFSVKTTQANDKYMNSPTSWNNNNNRFGMGVHGGGYYTFAYGNQSTGNTNLLPSRANDGAIHNWVYKNYICSVTDLNISRDCSSYTFGATTANLRLFFGYNSNTSGKIAYYKHIKNGVVVVELIPVRIGTIGYLFDRVSGQLFGNSGTGSFVLGPDVAPGAYANEIAFLESTGSQYIDTGVSIDTNTKLVVDGKFTDALSTVRQCHGAIHNNSGTYNRYHIGNPGGNNTSFLVGLGTAIKYSITGDYIRHTFQLLGSGTAYIDSNQIEGDSSVPNLNIYLFARNFDNEADSFCEFILYSAKIYSGDTLVRDFIPVEYNNIGYLYDKVSGQFFANQGTGKFVLGHRAPRFDGKACARSYTRRQLMVDIVGIKPYISNGLVFHLDGADATTTSWVDRKGGVVFNMSNVVCDGKGVYFKGATSSYGHSSTIVSYLWNSSTIEVVIHKTQASGFVFQSIGNCIAYLGGAGYVNYTHGISKKRSAVTGNMQLNKTITHSINNDIEFFNGKQYGFSSADTWGNQNNGTWLGIREGNSYPMKGYIYQIRIYNRKLSATEILFNQEQDRKKYGIQF